MYTDRTTTFSTLTYPNYYLINLRSHNMHVPKLLRTFSSLTYPNYYITRRNSTLDYANPPLFILLYPEQHTAVLVLQLHRYSSIPLYHYFPIVECHNYLPIRNCLICPCLHTCTAKLGVIINNNPCTTCNQLFILSLYSGKFLRGPIFAVFVDNQSAS